MTRQVLAIDLKDDEAVAIYRDHHRRVWPEVLDSLHNFGVVDMEIYLVGRRLVMIVDTQDGCDLRAAFDKRVASHPRVAEWERPQVRNASPAAPKPPSHRNSPTDRT